MHDRRLRLVLATVAGLLPGAVAGLFLAPGHLAPTPAAALDAASPERGPVAVARPAGPAVPERARPIVGGGASTAPTPIGTERADDARVEGPRTLLDELRALLASGRVEELLGANGESLLPLLVRLHCELGDAASALALLEGREDVTLEQWLLLANLATGRDPAVAALGAERALRHFLDGLDGAPSYGYPLDQCLAHVAAHDPGRALELLTQLRELGMGDVWDTRRLEVQALFDTGRRDLALAAIDALLADEDQYVTALGFLLEFDPVGAERELRTQLDGPLGSWAASQLVGLLVREGRTFEAIERFESALASGQADGAMWNVLLSALPPATVAANLDAWLAVGTPRYDAMQTVANHFLAQGDTQATLDAYGDLWDLALESGGWLPQLPFEVMNAHPSESLALLDGTVSQLPENDEMWGDVADAYWQLGATGQAVSAWEHAALLDPNDSEWSSKLAAVAGGGSPIWTPTQGQLGDVSDLWPEPPPVDLLGGGWYGGEYFGASSSQYLGDLGYLGYVGEMGYLEVSEPFDGGWSAPQVGLEVLESLGYATDGE